MDVLIPCLTPLAFSPTMVYENFNGEDRFGTYPPDPAFVVHAQVYAPLQESPGLFKKVVGKLEVLEPMENFPMG